MKVATILSIAAAAVVLTSVGLAADSLDLHDIHQQASH
jgi:hypothetical protein